MERDSFDAAIDEILASADGDVRRAMRAILVENVRLEAELRHLYAVSAHGKPSETKRSSETKKFALTKCCPSS